MGNSGVGNVKHLDVVMDLGVCLVPYPVIVSAGRDGVVKVWK